MNTKYKKKVRTTNLTRFGNLPTSLRRKEEDLIQPAYLQGLQSDPKIQLEKLNTTPYKSHKQTNPRILNTIV